MSKEELDTQFEAEVKNLLSGYLSDESSRDYVAFKITLLHRNYTEQEMSSSGEWSFCSRGYCVRIRR